MNARRDPTSDGLDEDQAALRFAASRDAALCTIVGIDGSFSRRLGAQLAIGADDEVLGGSLSDGCLEQELVQQASSARAGRSPVVLRYGRGSPFIDFRLPCGSGLDILIDPAPDRAALTETVARLDQRRPATLSLPEPAQALLPARDYIPALRLVLLGAGPELSAVARLAATFGAACSVAGPDTGLGLGGIPDLDADPWTAILLLFHDHEWERALLTWALSTPACYIGALGGHDTRETRKAWLAASGYDPSAIARIRSPMGLIPRARDPQVLALSVLAEVVSAYEQSRAI